MSSVVCIQHSRYIPIPKHPRRHLILQSLLKAYKLDENGVDIVDAEPCENVVEELKHFHSEEYVAHLQYRDTAESTISVKDREYNLVGSTWPFPHLWDHITSTVEGTLTACNHLCQGTYPIAIHWNGGRHHARPSRADGFCYVNDVVLACISLRDVFGRVLCVDVDVHHGDGTAAAFEYDDSVFTLSFHQYGPGVYPGTGALSEVGEGPGKHFSLNIPLCEGTNDEQYEKIFHEAFLSSFCAFEPGAIVLVVGTDVVQGDPLGLLNISIECITRCVRSVKDVEKPLLVLGGGGYDESTYARCLTAVTSVLCDTPIPADIPLETEHVELYAPDYNLYALKPKVVANSSKNDMDLLTLSIWERAKRIDKLMWDPSQTRWLKLCDGIECGTYLSMVCGLTQNSVLVSCDTHYPVACRPVDHHYPFVPTAETISEDLDKFFAFCTDKLGGVTKPIKFVCILRKDIAPLAALLFCVHTQRCSWKEGVARLLESDPSYEFPFLDEIQNTLDMCATKKRPRDDD